MTLKGKRILLVIGGGIAAYKSLELIRRLQDQGAAVRGILTAAAGEFITPMSVTVLAGGKTLTELFDPTDEAEIGHIELSREADLIVVAPATADLIAKMAAGIANDLATAVLLATDKRVLLAPAMNVRMWHHAATQRNVARIVADGARLVGPNEGTMACNEFGLGRMAEPDEIVAAVDQMLNASARPLAGRRVVVTSGPTREPIDPVRYISNHSSGKQGLAVAEAARALGADTVLVTGPTGLPDLPGVTTVHVETAAEMLEAVQEALPADIAVFVAAVADWRVAAVAGEKIKKGAKGGPSLALVENPDILRTIARSQGKKRPRLVIGFAAETNDVVANATKKRKAKGCDWMLANDVSKASGVMGGDRNAVHLIRADGQESWPEMTKRQVAEKLMLEAAAAVGARYAAFS
ncbi:MAG: bifunctional phosphopantothenoylcysteine decarboxylase/phosphopantothenate--cysteine ligase CoaBC [Hyphomicrobiaceae bacterium]|nr:MAG: bifunctional phosphopantothenoylcysteine decarboxylase/phosphopantothenate--cysteine ligase CoaBC [Hyphomicrobiaceae bacterium]